MDAAPTEPQGQEDFETGRSRYRQVIIGAIAVMILFLTEEIVTWNASAFVLIQAILLAIVAFLGFWTGKSGGLRWLLFMAMMLSGVYGFLLGGLHITDPKVEAIDPLCYWLAGGGLALLGAGVYLIYDIQIEYFLKTLRERRES